MAVSKPKFIDDVTFAAWREGQPVWSVASVIGQGNPVCGLAAWIEMGNDREPDLMLSVMVPIGWVSESSDGEVFPEFVEQLYPLTSIVNMEASTAHRVFAALWAGQHPYASHETTMAEGAALAAAYQAYHSGGTPTQLGDRLREVKTDAPTNLFGADASKEAPPPY